MSRVGIWAFTESNTCRRTTWSPLGNSSGISVYIFFKSYSKIGCRRWKVRREVYEAARVDSCFCFEARLYPKVERKRQKNSGMRITKGYLWRGHGLRLTSLALVVAKKREVPICSARTSLTYPSSFCQAGTRTTAGDPWLCKLQRNKHELRHRQIHTGF